MSAGAWGWPPLTRRCVAVLRRNFLVWRKTALTTVLGDVLDPVVALLALGFGLGALLPGIEGVPYVTFLSAGSMCVGRCTAPPSRPPTTLSRACTCSAPGTPC